MHRKQTLHPLGTVTWGRVMVTLGDPVYLGGDSENYIESHLDVKKWNLRNKKNTFLTTASRHNICQMLLHSLLLLLYIFYVGLFKVMKFYLYAEVL